MRECTDLVAARQAAGVVVVLDDLAVAQAHQPADVRADPQAVVAFGEQAEDGIAGQTVRARQHVDDASVAPSIQSAARADPHAAVAALHERAHVIVAEALFGVECRERRVAQAQQAGVGARPQAAFAIDEQRGDAIVRQAAIAAQAVEAVVAEAQQPMVDRADPQIARGIAHDARHAVAGEQWRHRLPPFTDETIGTAFGARVQRAVGHLFEVEDRRRGQAVVLVVEDGQPRLVMHDAVRGREPHRVVAIAHEAERHVRRQSVACIEPADLALRIDLREPRAFGRDPQAPALVEHGVHHFFLRESFLAAVRAPGAVVHHAHAAARGADDERTVRCHADRTHAVVAQRGRVATVDDVEFEPVVTDEAFPGAEPEIAVGGLRDRVDLVVRQPFAGRPGFAEVGVDGFVARRRGDARGQRQEREQQQGRDRGPVPCGRRALPCVERTHPTPSEGLPAGPCAADSRPVPRWNRARR